MPAWVMETGCFGQHMDGPADACLVPRALRPSWSSRWPVGRRLSPNFRCASLPAARKIAVW